MSRVGSKAKIRQFLLANIGRVIEAKELQEASGGAAEFARRTRELRELEGWPILTHNDSADLKPGQYLLKEQSPAKGSLKIEAGISARLRAQVLDRNGFTCQMCGLTPGDIDPATGRKVRLHIGHINDRSLKGETDTANLRALCSTCNQGAKNVTAVKPPAIWLLSQVRRAGVEEQKAVYGWLKKKLGS